MVRRRKFLGALLPSKFQVSLSNVIVENVYFSETISTLSSNKRFFWKKINHFNRDLGNLYNLHNFAKLYSLKSVSNSLFKIKTSVITFCNLFSLNRTLALKSSTYWRPNKSISLNLISTPKPPLNCLSVHQTTMCFLYLASINNFKNTALLTTFINL